MTVKRIYIKFIVLYSGVAQLAEQVTVNHFVGGSSPSSGGRIIMAIYTVITGLLLVLLGVIGYLSYGVITVLIPSFLGVLVFIFGILALKASRQRRLISSCDKVFRPLAVFFRSMMALILLPYFLVAISFFIRARLSK